MAAERESSFTCPHCGQTSYHPKDVEYHYCGNCHLFMGDVQRLADQLGTSLAHAVAIYRNEVPFPST